jgi:hypothetical protein
VAWFSCDGWCAVTPNGKSALEPAANKKQERNPRRIEFPPSVVATVVAGPQSGDLFLVGCCPWWGRRAMRLIYSTLLLYTRFSAIST